MTPVLPVLMLEPIHIPASGCDRMASPTKLHLDDILLQARAGDPDAFTELYLRYKKRVFSICMHMVHDFCLAEDLTQDTFLQLHRKLASYRGESLFSTWLHRMTVNMVLMRLRKRAVPVVSLDQIEADIPGNTLDVVFACSILRKWALLTASPFNAPWTPCRLGIGDSSFFMMSMVFCIAKLPQWKVALRAIRDPSCTWPDAHCAVPFPHHQNGNRRTRLTRIVAHSLITLGTQHRGDCNPLRPPGGRECGWTGVGASIPSYPAPAPLAPLPLHFALDLHSWTESNFGRYCVHGYHDIPRP